MIVASLVMAPLALALEAPWTLAPSTGALLAAAYLGLIPTALATIILFHLLQNRSASFIAPINYLIPVFGVLWGVVVLGEGVSPRAATALAVILAEGEEAPEVASAPAPKAPEPTEDIAPVAAPAPAS